MKKNLLERKEPAPPNIRKGLSSSNRKEGFDPSSSASAGGNKRLFRTSKLVEQRESYKNYK